MDAILTRVVDFFTENFPSPASLLVGGPPGLVWAYGSLSLAGFLRTRRGLKTGYTRKVFHFLIFSTAAAVQALWGTRGVCLFGGMTTLVIFHAVLRGAGHPHYEAIAREKDAPHRTYFIVVPYFATLIGGVAANLLVGEVAVIGYLVTGLGDAVAEPVGTRFGRHPYRVPSFRGVACTRTLEGSIAVLVASSVGIALGAALCPGLEFAPRWFVVVPALALGCALLEAASPHGWDNAVMQLVPSLLARACL